MGGAVDDDEALLGLGEAVVEEAFDFFLVDDDDDLEDVLLIGCV